MALPLAFFIDEMKVIFKIRRFSRLRTAIFRMWKKIDSRKRLIKKKGSSRIRDGATNKAEKPYLILENILFLVPCVQSSMA